METASETPPMRWFITLPGPEIKPGVVKKTSGWTAKWNRGGAALGWHREQARIMLVFLGALR